MVAAVKDYCTENGKEIPWFNIEIKSRRNMMAFLHPSPTEFAQLLIDN